MNGFGVLRTCRGENQNASIVMLSNRTPNSSMTDFMKYIYNAHNLYSIILQCNHLKSVVVTVETCECNEHGVTTSSNDSKVTCNCIAFWTVVRKPTHKKTEKIDQRLRIWPLRGGNLLYITQMNNSWMIQMTKPPFYI